MHLPGTSRLSAVPLRPSRLQRFSVQPNMQYPALVTSSGLACITDFAHVGEIGDIGHKGGSYDENAPIEHPVLSPYGRSLSFRS